MACVTIVAHIIHCNGEQFMNPALTVNEAAALVGVDEQTIRKEVEYGLFGSASPPRFRLPALVYLRAVFELGFQTTVADRKRIYTLIDEAFSRREKPIRVQLSSVLELKLDAITEKVESMLQRFEAWKKRRVVVDPEIMGGEPVFSASRLTVRHIGSMMLRSRAYTIEEIREDYPNLSDEDIEFAKLYTAAYPKVGRPRARETPAR